MDTQFTVFTYRSEIVITGDKLTHKIAKVNGINKDDFIISIMSEEKRLKMENFNERRK